MNRGWDGELNFGTLHQHRAEFDRVIAITCYTWFCASTRSAMDIANA
jgi:hypothetical protein